MCNNVSQAFLSSHCHHISFQFSSCSPTLALSAFLYFIVHLFSFIVHLLTSSHFHCFNTASSHLLFNCISDNTIAQQSLLLVYLSSQSPRLCIFIFLFVLSRFIPSLRSPFTVSSLIAAVHFPAFVSLIRLPATLWGKWCERVLHGLSEWVSSQHTKGP